MRTFIVLLLLNLLPAFRPTISALDTPCYYHANFYNPNLSFDCTADGSTLTDKRPNSARPYRLRKVVIDAGHGGKDTGCLSKNANEKDITLGIALKLGNYIKDLMPSVQVIYTRNSDYFVELHERAAIANRNGADLFISIHCNSVPKATEVHGTETYVMGLHKSRENLEVAMRENAVIALEANYKTNYDGFDPNDPQGNIIFSLYQNAYIEQSIKFASLLEKQFKQRANRASRGVKQEGFLVLYKTTMPSVLVETGFLSNSSEEKYLRSDDGQSLIASAIYRAFKEYKQSVEAD